MFQFLLLGFTNVENHCSGGTDAGFQIFAAKTFQGDGFKLIGQALVAPFILKRPVVEVRMGNLTKLVNKGNDIRFVFRRFRQQDLPGTYASDLFHNGLGVF